MPVHHRLLDHLETAAWQQQKQSAQRADDNWTVETEDGGPYFQNKYGGISYSNLDYKLEDGKDATY